MDAAEATKLLAALATGVCLSAACGFRVFVPPLIVSVLTHLGYVRPAAGWTWIGDSYVIAILATAAVLEVAAYYIPWLDHALDAVAAPAAVVAGVLVSASLLTDVPPVVKWSLAIIAGGGAAGLIQSATMAARAASTAVTGGLTNPVVSSVETAGSFALSALAIAVPVAAVLALLGIFVFAVVFLRRVARRVRNRRSAPIPDSTGEAMV